jgi:superfamily II DNA or RNA helicase
MAFIDLNLKKTYSSDIDDILRTFFIPVLKESKDYKRLTGFFSSSSLAAAAEGFGGLIENDGFVRMVMSPKISYRDFEIMKNANNDPQKFVESKIQPYLVNIEDEFTRDHFFALGWMLANEKIEIRVAIPFDKSTQEMISDEDDPSSIFHQKVAIFTDGDGNRISFSGSVNESASGWQNNIEEGKVFRSWESGQIDYLESDIEKFDRFWNDQSPHTIVFELPKAIKKGFMDIAPKKKSEISKILERWESPKKSSIKLFDYQTVAIKNWIKNDYKGIFEMATGTGKTFTALGCVKYVIEENEYVFIIIACPYKHLIQQWSHEIQKFGLKYDKLIISDSSNSHWKDELTNAFIEQKLKRLEKLIVLTTHRTFASDSFRNIVQLESDKNIISFLIADEVHGIGSDFQKRGLDEYYKYRLGLSATPERFFDDEGTNLLLDYFGPTVYEFTLKDALTQINPATNDFYLTQYRYFPIFVRLSRENLEDYISQTKKIALTYSKTKDPEEEKLILTQLLNKRANIVKNADEKLGQLRKILDSFPQSQKWTIIYCTPQQIDSIMKILSKYSFITHRFTMEEKTSLNKDYGGISEREYILREFAKGTYQILVAMKILDEGVDVPPARVAILMASSGNPREYIQRIGRVIRKFPGKQEAIIYDLIVVPTNKDMPPELQVIERKIFEKQLRRCEYISKLALNSSQALNEIYSFNPSYD